MIRGGSPADSAQGCGTERRQGQTNNSTVCMSVVPKKEAKAARSRSIISLIVKALLFVAAFCGFVYLTSAPTEPSSNGKSLSVWLKRYQEVLSEGGSTNNPTVLECSEAIRHIGTNGIPTLLNMLRARDSGLKLRVMNLIPGSGFFNRHFSPAEEKYYRASLGFGCLGELATNAIPGLVKIYNNPASLDAKDTADSVLREIYPAADTVVPYWVPQNQRAEWYRTTGVLKLSSGSQSNALLAFSECIRLDPTNASAYLNRSAVNMQLRDFTNALGDATKSIELNGSNEAAFYTRGLCKFALKDFKNADTDFTTAIRLDTNYFSAYNYRGLARGNLRKLDEALDDFNKAAELEPNDATILRNRALLEGMQKEFELALADISKSIELGGKDAMAYQLRGRVESALKDYKAAVPDFDKAIALNPKDPMAYAGRSAVKVYTDDFDGASTDVEKALQLNPKSAIAYMTRGCLKAKRGGEVQGALADLARAVELSPDAPETHAMLGLFQYRFSQWDPALENCRKALQMHPLASTADLRSYIWIIRAQKGEESEANQELEGYLSSLEGPKTNEWDASIARFLLGSLAESNFLHQATTTAKRPSAVRGQVCESLYYAGMKRKFAGDKQGALELFQRCLDTRDDNNYGYMNAGVEMRALNSK
jgi:tetratricopeptide (TPR) repeat protein